MTPETVDEVLARIERDEAQREAQVAFAAWCRMKEQARTRRRVLLTIVILCGVGMAWAFFALLWGFK